MKKDEAKKSEVEKTVLKQKSSVFSIMALLNACTFATEELNTANTRLIRCAQPLYVTTTQRHERSDCLH